MRPRQGHPVGAGEARLRFRRRRVQLALLTGLGAAWLAALDPYLGVAAVVTAKHILVALLLARPGEAGEEGGDEASEL